jgi:DNA-binding transcriptional MerR regulator
METQSDQSLASREGEETRQGGDNSQGKHAEKNADREAQNSDERLFTIGDVAGEFGVSLRALRFYEDRGLLHPCRRGTARLYRDRDRSHLRMILKGKQLGFTLTEIHNILVAREGQSEGADLELSLRPDQIDAQIRHLERQRADLDATLIELRHAHQRATQNAQFEVA